MGSQLHFPTVGPANWTSVVPKHCYHLRKYNMDHGCFEAHPNWLLCDNPVNEMDVSVSRVQRNLIVSPTYMTTTSLTRFLNSISGGPRQ